MLCRVKASLISNVVRSVRRLSVSNHCRMDLREVVSKIEAFAPLSLAEKWDNVGLLVEPSGQHTVHFILLTNDLTERVMAEAVEKKVQMVISYHPPIFVPLKRLTSASFKERIILKAVEERIAIYSPHTALDAVHNGVNDWLAAGLGEGLVEPLCHSMGDCVIGCDTRVCITTVPLDSNTANKIEREVCSSGGVKDFCIQKTTRLDGTLHNEIAFSCCGLALLPALNVIRQELSVIKMVVQSLSKVPIPMTGSGRLCTLSTPSTLNQLISRIKNHLHLEHVRLAIGQDKLATNATETDEIQVKSIAICAGSGASVLKGVKADVYLTGEMSHHEVLDAVSNGSHVILCEHSNTERGYLNVYQTNLASLLEGKVDIIVSATDADPLQIV